MLYNVEIYYDGVGKLKYDVLTQIKSSLYSRYKEKIDICSGIDYQEQAVNTGRVDEVLLTRDKQCSIISDWVILYIPVVSMWLASELWVSHREERRATVISPLSSNLLIKTAANDLYADVDSFVANVDSGKFDSFIMLHRVIK